jgi:RNA polymerase sigma factor (sigma-70 family)
MPLSAAPPSLTPVFRRLALAQNGGGLTDGRLLGEFVRAGDAAAFEALVRRHGPMVLGVCRRVVRDMHLADDAFQAVWLVLARKAPAVRPREHVGNWLYGVAYHCALKARRSASRWKSREKQVSAMPHPEAPRPPAVWSDLAPILDDELSRLPAVLRLPVVLCDLEGRPQRDAARQLGVPVTTLVTRLARARRTLAARLSGRGITLSGGALATVLSAHASAAVVPAPLSSAAVRAAAAVAAGAPAAVPAAVQFLSEGVLRMVLVSKLKAATASAVALAGLALGVGLAVVPTAAGQTAPADPPAKQPLATAARPLDDAAFLRRACVDLRGTPPTDLEQGLFRLDPDPKKRVKVVEWLLSEEPVKAAGITSNTLNLTTGTINTTGLTSFEGLAGITNLNAGPLTLSGTSTYTPLTTNSISGLPLSGTTSSNSNLANTLTTGMLVQIPYSTTIQAAYVGQKSDAAGNKLADPPEDPERAKLKREIAALKAKIEAFERVREKQAAEEAQRKTEAEAVVKWKVEMDRLLSKLKQAEAEKKLSAEPTPAQVRETAAAALLKLATAQEQTNKALAEMLVQENLTKLRDEKLIQEKFTKLRDEKLAQDKLRAAKEKESTAAEYKQAVTAEFARRADTDAAFLRRVVKEAYGVAPTALELKYFAEDRDPKKREKLVDLVLADPAVAKKLGTEAKDKLLADPAAKSKTVVEYVPQTRQSTYQTPEGPKTVVQQIYVAKARAVDSFGKLLDQVLDGKRTDEQIADAVCLATVGRYPTESEQKMMLASVTGSGDRRAAWKKVLDTLAGTKEAQAHAESFKR